jgi:high-affinity Fe2+/Pb2+ permease
MLGIIRVMLMLAVLVAAGYGVVWAWTRQMPPYAVEVGITLGVVTLAGLAVTLLARGRRTPG